MAPNQVRKNIFSLAGIWSQSWSHLISILHRSSSSLLLQYSSFCICFLIFSSWIFLARMLGFTSTCRSGFTFFCKTSIIKHRVNVQLWSPWDRFFKIALPLPELWRIYWPCTAGGVADLSGASLLRLGHWNYTRTICSGNEWPFLHHSGPRRGVLTLTHHSNPFLWFIC